MQVFVSGPLTHYNHLIGEIDAVYHEMSRRLGLSDSAMRILYTILCAGGDRCSLREICGRSGLGKQTVNSALRKLEAEGIAYLEPEGPRQKRVCLTDAGRRLAGRTALRILEAEEAVFAAWPQADVQQYLALTGQFLSGLRARLAALPAAPKAGEEAP